MKNLRLVRCFMTGLRFFDDDILRDRRPYYFGYGNIPAFMQRGHILCKGTDQSGGVCGNPFFLIRKHCITGSSVIQKRKSSLQSFSGCAAGDTHAVRTEIPGVLGFASRYFRNMYQRNAAYSCFC